MSMRAALRRSTWITFGVIVAFLWMVFTVVRVFDTIDFANVGVLGQGWVSGVVGLLVITIGLGLLVVLFSELVESSPTPETWPPAQ